MVAWCQGSKVVPSRGLPATDAWLGGNQGLLRCCWGSNGLPQPEKKATSF